MIILNGCVQSSQSSPVNGPISTAQTSSAVTLNDQNNVPNSKYTDIHIQNEVPGSLSNEAAIGNLHIGDSKSEVYQRIGEPDARADDANSGYESWIYHKHALTVQFFRASKEMPPSTVVDIKIADGSDLQTDTGIGILSTVEQITKIYPSLNGNKDFTEIWVNGSEGLDGHAFYPTLKFELNGESVQGIELTNKGIDPSTKQQKPLSLADLDIGGIRIGGKMNDVISKYGQPSEKTISHGVGSPYWIFKKQGLAIDFGGPIWRISSHAPFKGSTPRGIHMGSAKDEVAKAYPDMTIGNTCVQKSTDGQYSIQIGLTNGKVSSILISQDLVLQ